MSLIMHQMNGKRPDLSLLAAFVGAAPPRSPLRALELFRERFVGLVCARHPLAVGAAQNTVTIDDYLRFPHAMVSFRDPRQSPIDVALAAMRRVRSVALATPNFAGNIDAIEGADLIMSLPSRLAAQADRAGLVRFDLPPDVPEYPYSAVWHARSDTDQANGWLRRVLMETFR